MLRAGLIVVLVLTAGCSTGSEEPRDLQVERISSDAPGEGPQQPQAVVATSAAALSEAIGANVPDSGSGTYLAAYWGEKPTGGYSMSVRSARLEGNRVEIQLSLKEPPRDAFLTQALTYPYAVAVIRGLSPAGKDFSFVDENGRELDWPVRHAGG
jgi:PrcB C-terminal